MTAEPLYVHPKTEYQQLVDWLRGKPLRPPKAGEQPTQPAQQPAASTEEEDPQA